MGNSQPKTTVNAEKEEIPKISHEKFVNRQIIKNGPDEESIMIKLPVPHQKEYTSWAQQVDKVGQQQALLLPKSHSFKKEGFCGLSGIVELIYQNYPFLLSDQIHNRECLGTKFFQQNQLWYLVLTLLSAAEFFHSDKKKVGDIRPENVFISEDGSVKAACQYSWPMERPNYEKSFEKCITYIAPQEVNEMGFGKTQPSSAFDLAQTFSIGLTLLDASTLSDSQDLYKGQKSFDYDTLESRLRDLQSRQEYSGLLKGLVRNMCDVTPQNRTCARELYDWLSPFEEEINNFENFECNEVPENLRVELEKKAKSKTYVQQVPQVQVQTNNNIPASMIVSSNAVPVSNSPPKFQTDFNTYAPPTSSIPISAAPSGSKIMTSSGNYSPSIGFSYQHGMSTSTSMPMANHNVNTMITPMTNQVSKPITIPSVTTVPHSINLNSGPADNGAYGNKFSLQKIDEQLQQSRKMFPS